MALIQLWGACLVVGRLGFDSLAKSDQKNLKDSWFTAFLLDVQHKNGDCVKIGRQDCLLCPRLGKAINRFSLPWSGQTDSNRWPLNSKIKKVPLLSPAGRVTLTNK